jgi:superfamily II DNA or RNA helicase
MTILRAYQEKGIADIRAQFMRGVRHVCYVAPTGSGKTVLLIELVCRIRATRDQHVAIIVHRGELIDQTASALAAAGIEFGIVAAGYPEKDAPVLLCMAQTLANRLDRLVGWRRLSDHRRSASFHGSDVARHHQRRSEGALARRDCDTRKVEW